MSGPRRRRFWGGAAAGRAALLVLVLPAGCRTTSDPAPQIAAILHEQADAWNRGSIEDFLGWYVRGPELTFSAGGEVRRGWDDTLARYRQRYPDRRSMGTLSFSDLDTRPLGERYALTLGRWRLHREAGDVSGAFSLVWRREPAGWRILHDHTTQDDPPRSE